MGVYSKDNAGNIKQIAGNIVQRLNTRWFLCTRSIENEIEYYTVPASAQDYFKTIDSYTLYSFGFNEPNTTEHPILRYGNIELDILDFTTDDGMIVPGQLMGVFQMFTQDLSTDPKMYFVGNTHRDSIDTVMSDTSSNPVENKVIKNYVDTKFSTKKYMHCLIVEGFSVPKLFINIITDNNEPMTNKSELINWLKENGYVTTSSSVTNIGYPATGGWYTGPTRGFYDAVYVDQFDRLCARQIKLGVTPLTIDNIEYYTLNNDEMFILSGYEGGGFDNSLVDNVIQI